MAPVCGLDFFPGSALAKPLCDLSLDVGQKGRIVNIPPAPLHHHQQLSVDISPVCSCGRGQWNFGLLVIALPNISVSHLTSNPAPRFLIMNANISAELVFSYFITVCMPIRKSMIAKKTTSKRIMILGSVPCNCPLEVVRLVCLFNAVAYLCSSFSPLRLCHVFFQMLV